MSTAQYLAHALVADASEQFALTSWLDFFVSSTLSSPDTREGLNTLLT